MLVNWYMLAIFAGIIFGLEALIIKYISKVIDPTTIAAFYLLFGSIFLLSYSYFSHTLEVGKIFYSPYLPLVVLVGILSAIGITFVLNSYKLSSNVGYVRAVISLSIVVSYLLSFPLFEAKLNAYGILAIVLIIIGTLLFIKVE